MVRNWHKELVKDSEPTFYASYIYVMLYILTECQWWKNYQINTAMYKYISLHFTEFLHCLVKYILYFDPFEFQKRLQMKPHEKFRD